MTKANLTGTTYSWGRFIGSEVQSIIKQGSIQAGMSLEELRVLHICPKKPGADWLPHG